LEAVHEAGDAGKLLVLAREAVLFAEGEIALGPGVRRIGARPVDVAAHEPIEVVHRDRVLALFARVGLLHRGRARGESKKDRKGHEPAGIRHHDLRCGSMYEGAGIRAIRQMAANLRAPERLLP
jgi:hypothetical protein